MQVAQRADLVAKPITIKPITLTPPTVSPPPDVCIPPIFAADEDDIAAKLNSGELLAPTDEPSAADSFAVPTIRPVKRCEDGPVQVKPV